MRPVLCLLIAFGLVLAASLDQPDETVRLIRSLCLGWVLGEWAYLKGKKNENE